MEGVNCQQLQQQQTVQFASVGWTKALEQNRPARRIPLAAEEYLRMPAGVARCRVARRCLTIKARKLQADDGNCGTEDIEGVDGDTGEGAIDGPGRGSTGC